jgi:competence ComEA-like helix-hairpin-helix protein
MPGQTFELWTNSQRRGLAAILFVLIAIFFVHWYFNRQTIPDPQPARGPLADQLADRLDPNTATASELAAIPDLGEKRAQTIVDFRDEWIASHPGRKPFHRSEDLMLVKGIGPTISERLDQYLIFPANSTTRP